ncbi:MAG: GNAT family N-acetyltransferase [Planctomycetota bacterium]|nr:GNAT family N-acetyltransferase [Planctomycetota bacterium]MDA1213151.1 GNAT family N-acetyltransferase [Planctomycetota bacterium]
MTIATTPQMHTADSLAASSLVPFEIDEAFRWHQSRAYWRWLELFQADRSASILHHPDYLFHDLRAQREMQGRPAFFLTSAAADGPSWAGGLVPKTINLSRFVGLGRRPAVHGYRLVGDRLFGNGSPDQTASFFNDIEKFLTVRHADYLLIEDAICPSPTWDLISARRDALFRFDTLMKTSTRYGIRLPANQDDYWKGLSKNARKQNRKILSETNHWMLWRVTDVSHVPDFLAAAKTVAQNSWQRERLRGRISNDEVLLQRLTFLAQNQALRSYVLFDGETPVAFELDVQFNGEMLSESAAYDTRYAEFGPGRALLLRVLADLFEHDCPVWYDFGSGEWDYKQRFSNVQLKSTKVWLVKWHAPQNLNQML